MPSAAIFATLAAPWGPLHVGVSDRGVAAIAMLVPEESFVEDLERRLHGHVAAVSRAGPDRRRTTLDRVTEGLEAHLTGDPGGLKGLGDLPLDLAGRPAWDQAVLGGVRAVGWGRVSSYGRIAVRIGRPGAARAVGGALGRNPISILIPCHRIIAGDGSLGGYGGNGWSSRDELLAIKRQLLAIEGVAVPVRFGVV